MNNFLFFSLIQYILFTSISSQSDNLCSSFITFNTEESQITKKIEQNFINISNHQLCLETLFHNGYYSSGERLLNLMKSKNISLKKPLELAMDSTIRKLAKFQEKYRFNPADTIE